jgi:hypothetical protein
MEKEVPGWGVKLQTEVEQLQIALGKHMAENRDTHKDLYQKVERPSWTVTWVLTVMGGLVGSLLVWAVTHAA